MPNYSYKCKACYALFEKVIPVAERDDQGCPECGTKHVERLLGAPALRFYASPSEYTIPGDDRILSEREAAVYGG